MFTKVLAQLLRQRASSQGRGGVAKVWFTEENGGNAKQREIRLRAEKIGFSGDS